MLKSHVDWIDQYNIVMYSETRLCDHLRNRDNLGRLLRTPTPVARPILYTEMDLRNRTTSELRTVFHSSLGVPTSQVPLYVYQFYGLGRVLILF